METSAIKTIDKVGRTAFLIAQWREEETERIRPLFHDHIANIFLDMESKNMASSITGISPSTKLLVTYRTKFFDEDMIRHIEDGVEQVLILGAGLDTRSLRLGTDSIRVFEADKREVLEFKAQTLADHGYHYNSIYVPSDYTEVSFFERLSAHSFDYSLKTYVIWEGNTMYLNKDDAVGVLLSCKNTLRQFTISFDYLSEKLVLRNTGVNSSANLVQQFDTIGAEWRTGFDDIKSVADTTQLKIIDNFLIAEYIAKWDSRYKSATSILNDYSICSLAHCP